MENFWEDRMQWLWEIGFRSMTRSLSLLLWRSVSNWRPLTSSKVGSCGLRPYGGEPKLCLYAWNYTGGGYRTGMNRLFQRYINDRTLERRCEPNLCGGSLLACGLWGEDGLLKDCLSVVVVAGWYMKRSYSWLVLGDICLKQIFCCDYLNLWNLVNFL